MFFKDKPKHNPMEDLERANKLLQEILFIVPEQRICQIISNSVRSKTGDTDIYFFENKQLIKALEDYIELYNTDRKNWVVKEDENMVGNS